MAQHSPLRTKENETFDYALQTTLKRYAQAYHKFINGGYDDLLYTGTTIRPQGRAYLVIVRATSISPLRNLVVFGNGDTLADALRNVSIAIGKNQWKQDKYNP